MSGRVQPEKTLSFRQQMLDEIWKRVRTKSGGKYPIAMLALKIQHLSNQDLDVFVKTCNKSGNFSKCFWGLLKVK